LLLQNLTDRQRGILVTTAHHRNVWTETLLRKLLSDVQITNLVGMDIVTEIQTTSVAPRKSVAAKLIATSICHSYNADTSYSSI